MSNHENIMPTSFACTLDINLSGCILTTSGGNVRTRLTDLFSSRSYVRVFHIFQYMADTFCCSSVIEPVPGLKMMPDLRDANGTHTDIM